MTILGPNGEPADSSGEYVQVVDNGPKIRLLYCYQCKTIEELPDFEGRPEDGHLLEILVERHQSAGVPHTGFLSKIGLKTYTNHREEIVKNLRNKVGGGLADLDPDYYTTKATFYDDAMKCYNAHLRPEGACSDWKASNKKLVPNTVKERKELGLSLKTAAHTFLCDFCPVKTYMVTKARKEAGMYNE
jgi:hypothetical protein